MIEATMKEKVKEFIVKNFKWIILFICLIGFLAIAENVFNKEIMNGDIVGYKLISTFLKTSTNSFNVGSLVGSCVATPVSALHPVKNSAPHINTTTINFNIFFIKPLLKLDFY